MVDILIQPPELRQISEQLRTSAQKIGSALQAIDNDIRSLKGDKFLGSRSDKLQVNYAPKREALIKAKDIVLHFSSDLKAAADVFEKADNSNGETTNFPLGYVSEENVNSTSDQRVRDILNLLRETEWGRSIVDWLEKFGVNIKFGDTDANVLGYASGDNIVLSKSFSYLSDYEIAATLIHEGTHYKDFHPSDIPIIGPVINAINGAEFNVLYAAYPYPEEYRASVAEASFWKEVKEKYDLPSNKHFDGKVDLIYTSDGGLRDPDTVYKDLHNNYGYDGWANDPT